MIIICVLLLKIDGRTPSVWSHRRRRVIDSRIYTSRQFVVYNSIVMRCTDCRASHDCPRTRKAETGKTFSWHRRQTFVASCTLFWGPNLRLIERKVNWLLQNNWSHVNSCRRHNHVDRCSALPLQQQLQAITGNYNHLTTH